MAGFEGLVADRSGAQPAWPGPAGRGQSQCHQWHSVAAEDWHALARCAGEIWQLELDLPALSTMERQRRLGKRGHHAGRDDGGKRPLQHRLHLSSRPCLGSGRKGGIHRRALGRSRGGFTSKVHCLSDARGRPIAFHLTPGEAADCKAYDTLIDLPEQQPKALLADKAYDTDAIRYDLKQRGIKAVIPPKSNRKTVIRYNKRLYRQRNCIERVFGHLKINRAIATRYDQLADSFLGMLFLASARYWLKFVHAA
jgi:transposase